MKIAVIRYICLIGVFLLLFIAMCSIEDAFAAFNLSITPYEGGYDLRYGKVDSSLSWINKEVNVDIRSDIQKQYRLIQRLVAPLTNDEGDEIPLNDFRIYALRGTNKYGTLSVGEEVPVRLGRQIVYTSNQTGNSDSFILVYKLTVPLDQPAGSYRARINYILEPIDSLQEAVTVNLNIYAEIERESKIEITTAFGSRRIELKKSDREEDMHKEVLVNITGNLGGQFRIMQEIGEPLQNSAGERLSFESVGFKVQEAQKGIPGYIKYTPLSSNKQLLYTSGPRGEGDSFVIGYSLEDVDTEKAGRYVGSISYILEGGVFLKQGLIDTFPLEVDIPRILDIIIRPEVGGSIEFRDLRPQQPPKVNEVIIEVKTNVDKKYQVSQNILSELTSPEGNIISEEYFTLRTERTEGSTSAGILKLPEKTVAEKGETVLFISNRYGDSDSFKVIYELSIPLNIRSGNYSTRITYSLSEI